MSTDEWAFLFIGMSFGWFLHMLFVGVIGLLRGPAPQEGRDG